jgi:hypothetical protein
VGSRGDAAEAVERPRGGSVRVGVWSRPDPAAPTLGGAAVRALVLPQLFVAGPDGRWSPSLVEPGSDQTAPDETSASFRIRAGATWSNSTAIGADDLRRSADARFVAGVDGPGADGRLTVRFTQRLPGWRRLWSFTDSVTPPAPGVWGGPFVVSSMTADLETVLRRNDRWFGGPGPFLDEVRLVLVPDAVTARQLLARGELDVVAPPAYTVRTRQLEGLDGVSVAGVPRGGWSVSLLLNPARLGAEERGALIATVDRRLFAGTLLRDEAAVLDGFAGPEDGTWAAVGPADPAGLRGERVDLVGMLEEPMTALLQRAMQKRAHGAGGFLELRNAEADRVERWIAEGSYDAAIVMTVDAPEPCWRCRWERVDAGLAGAADGGDASAVRALEAKLRDEGWVLPLWRGRTVVAWREGLGGVKANGFALSGAWNAWEWWRTGR